MMYKQNLAVALKVNGRVLREDGDTVRLPYGTEFSILVKNLNTVRALVRIQIDGSDIAEGTSFIVPANDSVQFDRFMKNGNMSAGLRFKFIERTAAVENGPRGVNVEDGLVRVEFEFERKQIFNAPYRWEKRETQDWYDLRNQYAGSAVADSVNQTLSSTSSVFRSEKPTKGISRGIGATSASFSMNNVQNSVQSSQEFVSTNASMPKNENGITVGGSVSNQQFSVGQWFPTDGVTHALVFKILGAVNSESVKKVLTVSTKIECPTCGKRNKSNTKFCGECGTGLMNV